MYTMVGVLRDKEVVFEGVIVGFEDLEEIGRQALFIQGSVNGDPSSFYLVVDSIEVYNELLRLGIGRAVSGKGVVLSKQPLVVKLLKLGEN